MLHFSLSIDQLDRAFIAGFLEGEACFSITEQNGGQSFSCNVAVSQRDDDQELLEWLVAATGVGRLHRVRAYRTSRPQVLWSVASQEDCHELVALIGDGFHGRRTSELDTWREAVSVWTDCHGDERRARLLALKQRLHALKRFRASEPTARPLRRRQVLVGYISGLVCAEGSFGFSGARPRFSMHLRADDGPLLEMLAATTGFGRVNHHRPPAPPLNPSSTWNVSAPLQLLRLVEVLREGGLHGRKRTEMEAWSVAVEALCAPELRGRAVDHEVVRSAAQRLAEIREYRPPELRKLLELPRRDIAAESIAALQKWSREYVGPLSCGAYNRWRRDGMPRRNTIAKAFGGWHAALAAAGLEERAAASPARFEAMVRGGEARREARRVAQRARVVAAVEAFERKHGRLPCAMEFFRWQRVEAPDAPSQASVYRLFPGGWAEVLAACKPAARAAA